jgi:hypothetical protein
VRFALVAEGRQKIQDQGVHALDEGRKARIALDMGLHGRIQAGHLAQVGVPMRVAQEPAVEHHVEALGHAALEGERLKRHPHGARAPVREPLRQRRLQVVRACLGGVEQDVGAISYRGEQGDLLADAGDRRGVGHQRVAAPGLGVAAHQNILAAVEKQQLQRQALAPVQPVDKILQPLDREIPVAHIHADGHGPVAARRLDQAAQHRHGDVVDGLEAQILEDVDRGCPPGAGRAGHDDQPLRGGPCQVGARCLLRRGVHVISERGGQSNRPWLRYCRIAAGK